MRGLSITSKVYAANGCTNDNVIFIKKKDD